MYRQSDVENGGGDGGGVVVVVEVVAYEQEGGRGNSQRGTATGRRPPPRHTPQRPKVGGTKYNYSHYEQTTSSLCLGSACGHAHGPRRPSPPLSHAMTTATFRALSAR